MIRKIFSFIISISLVLFIISCGSGVSKSHPEGWINDDTFRVMGMGSPSDDIDDKFRREVVAKQAAELDAKN
ncbi:hypothetical protein E6A51_02970, partial [Brachyspira hampsonii]|nr:hypothetical protein [Brachyspira hampsonii]MBW5395714.1 hypothetical protein [Brachyspira hampsonii]